MPKTVKHDSRRAEVAEAAWRVIARDGVDRTSIRAIAHELGLTTSVITHYFRDKDELMIFIMNRVMDHASIRTERFAAQTSGLKRFEQIIYGALPTDEKSFLEWQIWAAFIGHAVGREPLLLEHRKRTEMHIQSIALELKTLQESGLIRKRLDIEAEAACVLALIDGFGVNTVLDRERFGSDSYLKTVKKLISDIISRLTP